MQQLKQHLIGLQNTTVDIGYSSKDVLDYADIPKYIEFVCGIPKSAEVFTVEAKNIYAAAIKSGMILVLDRNNIKGYNEFEDDMQRKYITINNQLALWGYDCINTKNHLFNLAT